jgi:hypothetical protein
MANEITAATAINEEHRLAHLGAASAVQHAVKCGQLLAEQKKACGHGAFLVWPIR